MFVQRPSRSVSERITIMATTTIITATNTTNGSRLVHRPSASPNGTFIGWGPKLGSI
jgi:hypothetical protein